MSLTSLYDGVGFGGKGGGEQEKMIDSSKIAGWSDNLQFMKTQLQLKKAAKVPTNSKPKGISASGPGTITMSSMSGSQNKTVLLDEYNPLRPNDYADFKERDREKQRQKKREDKEKEKERDREKDREERRKRSPDREDRKRRREEERRDRGKAAIAPPASLLEQTPVNPETIQKKDGAGTGGFQTGNVVASQIMAKYGWKEGQGLGREEQGLSTCLQVEKTGKQSGKIINKDVEKVKKKDMIPPPPSPPPQTQQQQLDQDESNITDKMKNPSKVVLLLNMVGPGDVDGDLQPEIEEECATKYGDINKVIIFEIPGAPEEEAVRIFVEFKRIESAVKALVDLNGRFFGGRSVSATFYSLDRFRRLDLAG